MEGGRGGGRASVRGDKEKNHEGGVGGRRGEHSNQRNAAAGGKRRIADQYEADSARRRAHFQVHSKSKLSTWCTNRREEGGKGKGLQKGGSSFDTAAGRHEHGRRCHKCNACMQHVHNI